MAKRIIMSKKSDILTLGELHKDFIKSCKARNLSPSTIKYYDNCYHIVQKFQQEILLKEIDSYFIREYILFLQQTMKPVSINTQLIGLRSIVNHGYTMGIMKKVEIKKIKIDKEIKDTYSNEQVKRLLEKPDIKKCSFAEYRTWMMINWFTATGNRIGTAREIRIKDIDLENKLVTLKHNKNRNQNIVPLPTSLCTLLKEYLEYRGGDGDDFLFPTIENGQLAAQTIKCAVKRYNKSKGVNITSCHAFRRYFAKQCVLNGVDTITLQKLGGWKDLEMVRNYVEIYGTDIKNYDEVNPLEQIYSSMKAKIKMKGK